MVSPRARHASDGPAPRAAPRPAPSRPARARRRRVKGEDLSEISSFGENSNQSAASILSLQNFFLKVQSLLSLNISLAITHLPPPPPHPSAPVVLGRHGDSGFLSTRRFFPPCMCPRENAPEHRFLAGSLSECLLATPADISGTSSLCWRKCAALPRKPRCPCRARGSQAAG